MKFAKYEGLGNDFLLVDAAEMPLDALTPDRARALCDRHRGVGGDGVLWVDTAGLAETGHVRMVIRNADGSRPEMCGNGVRCVAAWLRDSGRAEYRYATDEKVMRAFELLCRTEGIIPALESAHALAGALEVGRELGPDGLILVNLSGRGDKDMHTAAEWFGLVDDGGEDTSDEGARPAAPRRPANGVGLVDEGER